MIEEFNQRHAQYMEALRALNANVQTTAALELEKAQVEYGVFQGLLQEQKVNSETQLQGGLIQREQKRLLRHPSIGAFYQGLLEKLSNAFLAAHVLASGKISPQAPKSIRLVGALLSLVPYAGTFCRVLTAAARYRYQNTQTKQAQILCARLARHEMAHHVYEGHLLQSLVWTLTERYQAQLRCLAIKGGVDVLVDCVVAKIIYLLGHDSMIQAESLVEDVLEALAWQSLPKEFGTFFRKRLVGIELGIQEWTDEGVLQRTAIRVQSNGHCYSYKGPLSHALHRPDKYGFRYGHWAEIQKRGPEYFEHFNPERLDEGLELKSGRAIEALQTAPAPETPEVIPLLFQAGSREVSTVSKRKPSLVKPGIK